MSFLRTVKIVLNNVLSPEQKQAIVDTAVSYNACTYEYISKCCELQTTCNKNYSDFYKIVRERHPETHADLVQGARKHAESLVKSHNSNVKRINSIRKCRHKEFQKLYVFTPCLAVSGYRLTKNMISFKDNVCSMSVNNKKRIKFTCVIPRWFTNKYHDGRMYSWYMSCKETKGKRDFVLHVVYIFDETDTIVKRPISPDTVIGIDRGIYNVVATSNSLLISDKPYYAVERRYAHNVETLKHKHSPSARARLRSMSGKRRRFINNKNHIISKFLCNIPNVSCLVFENLTNITKNVRKKGSKTGKKLNRWLHSWSFKDLENKVCYKAEEKGITVAFVDPRNTSKTCSSCGYVEEYKGECRRRSVFKCVCCGKQENADLNAAKNIRNKYLENVSNDDFLSVTSTTHNAPVI